MFPYYNKKIHDCFIVSLTKQSKFRPKSALNDRIVSGTQTLRLKASSSRCSVVKMFCIYLQKKKKITNIFSVKSFSRKIFREIDFKKKLLLT